MLQFRFFDGLVNEKEREINLKSTDEVLDMIVLDRSIEFLTALIINYTYEGLIDDLFGINWRIKIKESYIKDTQNKMKQTNKEKIINYSLTSFGNTFYNQIGYMHYLHASDYIVKLEKYYVNLARKSKNKEKASLSDINFALIEMRKYKKEVRWELIAHQNILFDIQNNINNPRYKEYIAKEQLLLSGELPKDLHLYYEDYISDKRDLTKILKLMVIESLTQGGISNYNDIKKDILNVYGYQNSLKHILKI